MPIERWRALNTRNCRPLVLAAALTANISAPLTADAESCNAHNLTARSVDIECSLSGSERDHALVEVRLGGFHDDSSAALTLEADGSAVACALNDRTALSGQGGDVGTVTLTCRFDLAPLRYGSQVVRGQVDFNHAEFAGAYWRRVPPDP